MASVTKNKGYGSYLVEMLINKRKYRFYGFSTRKEAKFVCERLEDLEAGLHVGYISPVVQIWLNDIWNGNPNFYQRLVNCGLARPRERCGTLAALIDRYVSEPIHGKIPKPRTSSNRRVAANMLVNYLANQRPGNFKRDGDVVERILQQRADFITKEIANQVFLFMQNTYQIGTWGRRIKHIKTMYALAVSLGWMETNPFGHLRGCAEVNRTRDFYVTPEIAASVLSACPDARSRLIFSLGRWGALRMPSEIAFLKWSDVQRTTGKIRISIPKKTGKIEQERGNFVFRYIPLFPEIRLPLDEFWQESGRPSGDELIFPHLDTPSAGARLKNHFVRILKQAGIPVWPKFFHNLRATRDTELQNLGYPFHQVCRWLGHSPQVSLTNYTQLTDADYLRASGSPPLDPLSPETTLHRGDTGENSVVK